MPASAMLEVMRTLALILLFVPATAAAEQPGEWLFRATPGFGYAWDRDVMCPVEGRMFVGGFHLGRFVTPNVLVGAGTAIGFNALPARTCPVDDALVMTFGFVVGPEVDWYPGDQRFHLGLNAGFAAFDQDDKPAGRGAGGTLSIGYDWRRFGKDGGVLRLGVALQTTILRTTQGHATVLPGLVMTVGGGTGAGAAGSAD